MIEIDATLPYKPSSSNMDGLRIDGIPLIRDSGSNAQRTFLEFFAAAIRNPNTRQAYYRAASSFLEWAELNGIRSLKEIEPLHVAAWVELSGQRYSPATVKQQLAGLKMLFDWLVVRHVLPASPATSVRSPRHVVRKGKTPALDPAEARQLVSAIDTSTPIGLRDRALIGLMIFTFARVGAALAMRVGDAYVQNRRLWVRLHEKGGKLHDMPCQHELEEWLHAYIEETGIEGDREAWLFRSCSRTGALTENPLAHANAYMMVKRRARRAGIQTAISNHSFRATGITAYLSNGGTLEQAARMANHASTRTTQLYDRRDDGVTLSEVEKVRF